jgi:signal peptidase I
MAGRTRGNFSECKIRCFLELEGQLKLNHSENQLSGSAADSLLKSLSGTPKMTHRGDNDAMELACGLTQEVVQTFGEVRLRVFGTSMVPAILPGDQVLIQRASLEEILPGEIAVFLRSGRLFVHRVVDRKMLAAAPKAADELCLITRGDRQRASDSPVYSSELLGRVVWIERDRREIKVAPNHATRLTARVLQSSDKVTSLYLRLSTFKRTIFPRRASCQA